MCLCLSQLLYFNDLEIYFLFSDWRKRAYSFIRYLLFRWIDMSLIDSKRLRHFNSSWWCQLFETCRNTKSLWLSQECLRRVNENHIGEIKWFFGLIFAVESLVLWAFGIDWIDFYANCHSVDVENCLHSSYQHLRCTVIFGGNFFSFAQIFWLKWVGE